MHDSFRKLNPVNTDTIDLYPFGLFYPLTRRYHRGHTWIEEGASNTTTIGLDALGERTIGQAMAVELPAAGTVLKANLSGFTIMRDGTEIPITSPVAFT